MVWGCGTAFGYNSSQARQPNEGHVHLTNTRQMNKTENDLQVPKKNFVKRCN
jgi:hypothetical protein